MTTWKIQFKDVVLAEYTGSLSRTSNKKQVDVPSSVIDKIDANKKILYLKVLPYLIFKGRSNDNSGMIFISYAKRIQIRPFRNSGDTILWESDQALVDRVLAKILDR